VAFIIILILKDRKKIERDSVILMRKTERGRAFLNKVANISPKFWKYFGSGTVFICFGVMGFGIFLILRTLYTSLISQGAPGLSLVIPLPIKEPILGYGFLGVPFWFWIIPVATVMLIHEGFHGIMMKSNRVKIQSLGWVFLAVIPGAFVEPDEESLDKSNWKTKLRIFAAGSTGNFVLFIIILGFTTLLFAPAFFSGSIGFTGYVDHNAYNLSEPFPANKLNLTPGIVAIDGERMRSTEQFINTLNSHKPEETIDIKTTTSNPGEFKTYEVELGTNPDNESKPFLGILNPYYHEPADIKCTMALPNGLWNNLCSTPKEAYIEYSEVLSFLLKLFVYIAILNLGIGVFNLLPIKPLDGGLMVEALSEKFVPEHSEKIVRGVTFLMTAIILVSFLAPAI
ncbi:MAG: site-2 protease family protein, partial [Candidatus Aenigmatarchaeota archaeon]